MVPPALAVPPVEYKDVHVRYLKKSTEGPVEQCLASLRRERDETTAAIGEAAEHHQKRT